MSRQSSILFPILPGMQTALMDQAAVRSNDSLEDGIPSCHILRTKKMVVVSIMELV